jgi:ABC-type branched-subunit amino acid transport system substrate-binding protein
MYGTGYAWLGSEAIGAVDPLEWVTNSRIATVAKGAIIMQQTPSLDTFEQLQFVARYNARLFATPYETVSSLSALAYDSIMTLAYAIRDAKIANGDTSCSSTASSSTDSVTTRASVPSQSQIFTAAQSLSFAGASGAISFVNQALPGWHYAVYNMQGISLVRV